jgi:hypothetical protein
MEQHALKMTKTARFHSLVRFRMKQRALENVNNYLNTNS